MDFQPSEDQQALQEGIRAFCEGRFPAERFGEVEEQDAFDAALWSELAEMGVFGLRVPAEDGGVGLGKDEVERRVRADAGDPCRVRNDKGIVHLAHGDHRE